MEKGKTEQLNDHFKKWEKKQHEEVDKFEKNEGDSYLKHYNNKKSNLRKLDTKKSFTRDGIVDEKAWKSGKRILFILKEANLGYQLAKAKEDKSLIGDGGGFWFQNHVIENEKKKIDWRRGIFRRLKKIGIKHAKNDNFSLRTAAYMNINKRGGLSYAREDIINSYYDEYKDNILEEIRIIEPKIIAICCGEQDYAKKLKEAIEKEWGENIKVELYHHPAMRRIKDEDYIEPIG